MPSSPSVYARIPAIAVSSALREAPCSVGEWAVGEDIRELFDAVVVEPPNPPKSVKPFPAEASPGEPHKERGESPPSDAALFPPFAALPLLELRMAVCQPLEQRQRQLLPEPTLRRAARLAAVGRRTQAERDANAALVRAMCQGRGGAARFGARVQLQHVATGRFLRVRRAALSYAAFRVGDEHATYDEVSTAPTSLRL